MREFNIKYDMRPHIPDIFIKNKIFTSNDSLNNNKNIMINSTIFILNMNLSTKEEMIQYTDPFYMLFGIKNKTLVNPYLYPPLYFFYWYPILFYNDLFF